MTSPCDDGGSWFLLAVDSDGLAYPGTLVQFAAWFPDDSACLDYLAWLRAIGGTRPAIHHPGSWPDHADCPKPLHNQTPDDPGEQSPDNHRRHMERSFS